MKRTLQFSIVFIFSMLLFSSCARIIQGEVGVKRRFGKVGKKVIPPGLVVFNPFFTRVIKVPIRTVNLEISTGLPSKEGLTIKSEISILYRIKSKDAIDVLENIGLDFEEVIILPVFRSASADVCARFMAKDMHSAERSKIEREIRDQMTTTLEARGFIIEAVLMKNITLPAGLSKAIEDKLQAEQDALRMEFILQRESKDAERRVIMAEGEKAARITEAEGIKEANELMNASLTPTVLKYKSIEAYRELIGSNNAKVIISDGKTPIIGLPD
jgi:regulator of protease activity HflC (stomatin/prohibitin superfamily)